MPNILSFKVVGANKMNCGGCERSVKATLLDLPGVQRVSASHRTQDIAVTVGGSATGASAIKAELSEIGYEVQAL